MRSGCCLLVVAEFGIEVTARVHKVELVIDLVNMYCIIITAVLRTLNLDMCRSVRVRVCVHLNLDMRRSVRVCVHLNLGMRRSVLVGPLWTGSG